MGGLRPGPLLSPATASLTYKTLPFANPSFEKNFGPRLLMQFTLFQIVIMFSLNLLKVPSENAEHIRTLKKQMAGVLQKQVEALSKEDVQSICQILGVSPIYPYAPSCFLTRNAIEMGKYRIQDGHKNCLPNHQPQPLFAWFGFASCV